MKNVVIKIGASVVGKMVNDDDFSAFNIICTDCESIFSNPEYNLSFVVSGSLQFGDSKAGFNKKFPIDDSGLIGVGKDTIRKQILCSVGQTDLLSLFSKNLSNVGRLSATVYISRLDMAIQRRYDSILSFVKNCHSNNIIPIFSENYLAATSSDEMHFADKDQLAGILAVALQAESLILLTDTNGIYKKFPTKTDEDLINVWKGGEASIRTYPLNIRNKIDICNTVTNFGVNVYICNAFKSNVVSSILNGNPQYCTLFERQYKPIRQKKSWVALAAQSKGTITVSVFLADLLKNKKSASILPIGIEKIEGDFLQNHVVTVQDMTGQILGRGEVRYSSKELTEIISNLKSGEATNLSVKEVIHCDYFVHTP